MVQKEIGRSEFRWRGTEVSRIEGFSDAVFAFALTLLVVSLEVPRTFDELMGTMRGFVAFALCFMILLQLWYYHYKFFRHYGLQDFYTMMLNGILLFVVLFYVYPLKFLFTLLINQFSGSGNMVVLENGSPVPVMRPGQISNLMIIYGLGFAIPFFLFALLHRHAYRKRAEMDLNELETFDTQAHIRENLIMGGIGLISALIALRNAGLAGMTYFLIPLVMTVNGKIMGKKRRTLVEKASS